MLIQAFSRWRDYKTHILISLAVIILLAITLWISHERMMEIDSDKHRIDTRNNTQPDLGELYTNQPTPTKLL